MNVTSKIRSVGQLANKELLAHIDSYSSEKLPAEFTIKAVFVKKEDSCWDFVVGKCDFGIHESEGVTIYSDYAFSIIHYKSNDLSKILDQIYSTGLIVSEEYNLCVKTQDENRKWKWELIPSHATELLYPIYQYSCDINSNVNAVDMPLIGFGLPYFESSEKYIREFMLLDHFHRHIDVRNGTFFLNVPNLVSRLMFSENQVSIQSERDDVCVVGHLNEDEPLILRLGKNHYIEEDKLSKAELWLITRSNDVLDYRSKLTWPYKYNDVDEPDVEKFLLSVIEQGESLQCELKPYIDLLADNNKKAFQLEKTVCAFSNAIGGKLFLGVNDDMIIEGIDEKVCRAYGSSLEESLRVYCKDINKRLYESLLDGNCYEIYPIKINGVSIIVVSVTASERANYIRNIRQAFIRKGGTSAKMAFADERNDYARNPFFSF